MSRLVSALPYFPVECGNLIDIIASALPYIPVECCNIIDINAPKPDLFRRDENGMLASLASYG